MKEQNVSQKALGFVFKFINRSILYVRGGWLKVKIISLGGKCLGIPKVGAGVVWKYPPHTGISFSKGIDVGPGCYFDIPPQGTLVVGNNVKMTGNIYISSIRRVEIGDDSLIAEQCSIRDSEHLTSTEEVIRRQSVISGEILIGEDVWLCKGVTVLRGAIISKGTVLGAHSLIKNQETEINSIYAGTPAKKVKGRR
jgi:acetyltransferase-like isoleucine patch superfamily enzyme